MSNLNPYQDVLHEITQGAYRFKQMLGPPSSVALGQQQKLSPHHRLILPLPQPITPLLYARGLKTSIAEDLNKAYLEKASSLKQDYEHKHREIIKRSVDSGAFQVHDMDQFIAATHSTYTSLFNQSLRDWQLKIDEISIAHISRLRKRPYRVEELHVGAENTIERRPAFKNETVPVLEKAYNNNAYPSRADKKSLAEETKMEFKQINIWFQNRRARSKKEGLSLHRTATFATPLCASRYSTISPSPEPHFAQEDPSTHSPENCRAGDLSKPRADVFQHIERPSHAFPTPFPPLNDEEPFAVRSGAGTFPIPWLRYCAVAPVQRSELDIEQLTAQMASLSLSSDASSSTCPIPSFTFVLYRAPLPALIRTATASSRAQASATLVSAAGSSSASRPKETRKLYRALPARLPRHFIETRPQSLSPVTSSRPIPVPYSRTAAAERSRRSETRSPSPPHASRSSSSSSVASFRSSSSSWSVVSSAGPLTPSASPRVELLPLVKDVSRPFMSPHVHRPSSISDGVHISSAFR